AERLGPARNGRRLTRGGSSWGASSARQVHWRDGWGSPIRSAARTAIRRTCGPAIERGRRKGRYTLVFRRGRVHRSEQSRSPLNVQNHPSCYFSTEQRSCRVVRSGATLKSEKVRRCNV